MFVMLSWSCSSSSSSSSLPQNIAVVTSFSLCICTKYWIFLFTVTENTKTFRIILPDHIFHLKKILSSQEVAESWIFLFPWNSCYQKRHTWHFHMKYCTCWQKEMQHLEHWSWDFVRKSSLRSFSEIFSYKKNWHRGLEC